MSLADAAAHIILLLWLWELDPYSSTWKKTPKYLDELLVNGF